MVDARSIVGASYWIGAILDLLLAIMMLVPEVFSLIAGLVSFTPGADYQYAAAMAPVMLIGWTVLLIWADRSPFERIDVLLITVFPVLAGLIVNDIVGLVSGFLSFMAAMIFLGIQLFLAILLATAYLMAKRQQ